MWKHVRQNQISARFNPTNNVTPSKVEHEKESTVNVETCKYLNTKCCKRETQNCSNVCAHRHKFQSLRWNIFSYLAARRVAITMSPTDVCQERY